MNFAVALPPEEVPAETQALAPQHRLDLAKARFGEYLERVDLMVTEAQTLTVDSTESQEAAVLLGTSSKKLSKQIDDLRKRIVEDPNDFVKSVNGFAKVFIDKLTAIETTLKKKITDYRLLQEQKRREQEQAAIRAQLELQKKLDAEAKEKNIEPVQVPAPVIPKEQAPVRTETGSASARKVWTFEVVNASEVPDEYKRIDEAKIRDSVRAGIREIKGLRIYQEEKTSFRTN